MATVQNLDWEVVNFWLADELPYNKVEQAKSRNERIIAKLEIAAKDEVRRYSLYLIVIQPMDLVKDRFVRIWPSPIVSKYLEPLETVVPTILSVAWRRYQEESEGVYDKELGNFPSLYQIREDSWGEIVF